MANAVYFPTRRVRFVLRLVIMLFAICSVAAGVSAQTTVTLSTPGTHINADLTIQGGASGMVDFSTSDVLASKVGSSPSYTRRIMLKVDTQNFIPAKVAIQSARLYLVLKGAQSGESRPLTAYRVSESFVKGETNWYYFRPGQAWGTAGGDLGPSFGTTYVGNDLGSAYTFDLTDMVQRAVNGEFGSRYTRLALVDTGGSSSGNYKEFYSTRAANAAVRPRLVVTYTTSEPPRPTVTTIRVMQWNMHKTKGSDGICNPDRTVDTIVAQNVQVVSLNEVNFFSGQCAWTFDMGAKIQALLQQKTGLAWYLQNVNAGGVGNVLLSRYPPVSSSSTLLDFGRGVAQMGIVVDGRTINLFSTHVEWDNAPWRPIQIAEAVGWVANFSEPRIVMGDFNTWPGTSDYSIIATAYQDAWAAASSAGTARAYNGSGATHGASRFDYVFSSKVPILALESVNVPDTRSKGAYASDHDPVIAVFTVK
jgi:endonuclease/exonuclease/phosphatase family metal-dependent hydrolase